MPKPKPRTAAQITVDGLLVDHVRRAHAPALAMLREMGPELEAIRAEWGPWLHRQAVPPWAEWHARYFVPDLGPEVAALTARLAGVEAAVEAWQDQVMTLTPRLAWRFGPALRRQARGLRHEPALLLMALHKLRDRVAHVEAVKAQYAIVPSPRPPAWMMADPSDLRAPTLAPAKRDFDPRRIGR